MARRTARSLRSGTPCREGPDISANGDPFTGPAEYCTGSDNTPFSDCGSFESTYVLPGWFPIGGTSLSSPLLSGIFADRDSYTGQRTGNVNPLLVALFDTNPGRYFNDITGIGPLQQIANQNGLYPTTPGFDMATGIGSPKMAALITGAYRRPSSTPCGGRPARPPHGLFAGKESRYGRD